MRIHEVIFVIMGFARKIGAHGEQQWSVRPDATANRPSSGVSLAAETGDGLPRGDNPFEIGGP